MARLAPSERIGITTCLFCQLLLRGIVAFIPVRLAEGLRLISNSQYMNVIDTRERDTNMIGESYERRT